MLSLPPVAALAARRRSGPVCEKRNLKQIRLFLLLRSLSTLALHTHFPRSVNSTLTLLAAEAGRSRRDLTASPTPRSAVAGTHPSGSSLPRETGSAVTVAAAADETALQKQRLGSATDGQWAKAAWCEGGVSNLPETHRTAAVPHSISPSWMRCAS